MLDFFMVRPINSYDVRHFDETDNVSQEKNTVPGGNTVGLPEAQRESWSPKGIAKKANLATSQIRGLLVAGKPSLCVVDFLRSRGEVRCGYGPLTGVWGSFAGNGDIVFDGAPGVPPRAAKTLVSPAGRGLVSMARKVY